MKLSIITICYNEKEIRRTCESIVKQTWQDFEWIVVDGGSTDGTLDILNEYKERINILISEKDNGIYNAMNKGIKLAKGEWLNFMNGGDCFYDNDALKKVFDNDNDYAPYGVLYGYSVLSKKNKIQKFKQIRSKNYFIRNNINHQASFIRKKLFEKYGYYDETLKICSDFDKWCNFIIHNVKFKLLEFCVSFFDTNGISSQPKYAAKTFNERDLILKRYYSWFALRYEAIRRLFSFKHIYKRRKALKESK